MDKRFQLETRNPQPATLLVHLGGLGDVCLSESTFLSLSRHFESIEALGYTRYLGLFEQYFAKIGRIESPEWLHLFSGHCQGISYERIIFIGKDREGGLRERWQGFSREPLIFIDMYPEIAHTHVEDYQLGQLAQYGIPVIKKEIEPKALNRVILYPETGFKKLKWPTEAFIELYRTLRERGIDALILEQMGQKLDVENKVFFEGLTATRDFLLNGGIFVSNDSGMAHLAGACGLFTITIFTDFNPSTWRPRGKGITLKQGVDAINVPAIEARIVELMAHSR